MKTALLGGSFNPVHRGHILLALETLKLGYERIIFIPASQPPHKRIAGGASDRDRLNMLELALADFPRGMVWDGEIRRGGISYSIDTVREMKQTGILEGKPGLIIGDDLIGGFARWKDVDSLVNEVEIILARRHPKPGDFFPYPYLPLNNSIWNYSSTEVREHLKSGGNPRDVLPPVVADYVSDKGLYGYKKT